MASIDKTFNSFLAHLDDRQRDVVAGRFGLNAYEEPQTLAALGKKYGITRERVRQIQAGALRVLKEKVPSHPGIAEFAERSKKYLKSAGGLSKKEDFLKHHCSFMEDVNENHINLLRETSSVFFVYPEDKEFWSFYYLDEKILEEAKKFIDELLNFLRPKKNEIVSSSNYHEHFNSFVKKRRLNAAHAEQYSNISKKLHRNSYGDIGLAEWPEIKPMTVRDYIYLVLKKEKKPFHFVAIADLINQKHFGKRVLSPTVHNELIKDPRFVLVGRGIYGLSEYGYKPGTAREVIKRILTETGPMRAKEIIAAIQKERFFKPNTVLVNLQNKSFFLRRPEGTYQVRR